MKTDEQTLRGSTARAFFQSAKRIISAVLAIAILADTAFAASANVDFIGAESFSTERLRGVLSEQLGAIVSSGLTTARADDAAWYLGAFYRKEGFPSAEVTFQIRGSKLVLNVREGVRTFIQSLRFAGNGTFPDTTLYEYMVGVEPEKLAKAKLPYTESEVAAGAGRVRDFYASEGFLDAEVDTSGTRIVSAGTQADLVVRIVEGPRFYVGEIAFTGTPVFERKELLDALALKPDATFTPNISDDMELNLRSFFRGKGYFSAHVKVVAERTSAQKGRVPVTIECRPGPQFRIGRIDVRGIDRLRPGFMEKRFEPLTGKVYDPAKIDDRYRELLKTGLFKSLHVRPVPADGNFLNLDVEIEEAKAKEIGFEVGYGSYDGMSVGMRVGDKNFLGFGRALSLGIRYSQRGIQGELLHVNPWLFDSAWSLRSSLYSMDRDELGYSKVAAGLRLDLKRSFGPHRDGGAYLVVENTDITDIDINEALVGPMNYLLAAVGLTQTLDHRDDAMNPTRGWVFTTSADLDALDGQIAFARVALRYSWYRSFGKSLIGFGARAGWIIPTGDDEPVPIDLRYFNGGSTTIRSYADRELGPKDLNGHPLGGELYTVFNLEWDFPIAGAFGGAVFADAGSLSEDASFSTNDIRYAIGVGLRYALPIGPIRIDYGYNPSPKPRDERGAFHLSFGFAF
jgi:outer membrane protein assembly complex protein YaeT